MKVEFEASVTGFEQRIEPHPHAYITSLLVNIVNQETKIPVPPNMLQELRDASIISNRLPPKVKITIEIIRG